MPTGSARKDGRSTTNAFFANIAVEPTTYVRRLPEMKRRPRRHARGGAPTAGGDRRRQLAKKLGLEGRRQGRPPEGIYPGDWEFNIDGIYTATAAVGGRPVELLLPLEVPERRRRTSAQKEKIGWVVSRIDDPSKTRGQVSVAIDKIFDDEGQPDAQPGRARLEPERSSAAFSRDPVGR
jgi:putative ABC transport system permease protein